ncbi:bcl-2/adenovirus E1B 19 kDa-interacting protein 2-like protein isoform X2 [Alligator mississippiensis]|nr:bcl-2/adenovirus E1B 19 kDa-interacting protein 2-like protein isoform X2 [Alligator mississippiensis]
MEGPPCACRDTDRTMGSFVEPTEDAQQPRYQKTLEQPGPSERAQGDASIPDMELKEEWQDEEFPQPLPEDGSEEELEVTSTEQCPATPSTLELCGRRRMRRRLAAPALSLALDGAEGSPRAAVSPGPTPDGSLDVDVDALDTPSESELLDGFEWEDDLPRVRRLASSLSEGRVVDVDDPEGRRWRLFLSGEQEQRVDMSVVEPYTRVISHGGYHGDGLSAIILFASCYLPDSSVPRYPYVMEHLFRYIIGTLELMVAENYTLVCLSGATARSQVPALSWLRQCYQTIDQRLRKNMKALVIVHPTWYIRALVTLVRPFLSSKFSRKVRFVDSLGNLAQQIPLQHAHIPECIRQ